MTTPDEIKILRLRHWGNKLLRLIKCLPSVDELLKLLEKLEVVLASVEQSPAQSVLEALVPSLQALISAELLRHSDEGIQISVTSCITEITRITAPDAPYDEKQMKEIFKLTVAAFGKLSHVPGRNYKKAMSILDNVATFRPYVIMLDLECYDLIIDMFQNFLTNIRSYHPPVVMDSMESIMTTILNESEEISLDLFRPLLDSVRKDNQTSSPIAWTLGEKVITNCANKLKPCLTEAIELRGSALHEYAQIVTSICQNGSESLQHDHSSGSKILVTEGLESNATCERFVAQAVDDTRSNTGCSSTKANPEIGNLEYDKELKSKTELDAAPRKRTRKPNSLMNPEEGYDFSWISAKRKTARQTPNRKPCTSSTDFLPSSRKDKRILSRPADVSEAPCSQPKIDQNNDAAPSSEWHSIPDGRCPRSRRGRPRKRSSTINQDIDPNSVSMSIEENLNPLPEVNSLEPPCERLNKESEVRKDSKVRSLKFTIKLLAKTNGKTTIAPKLVVSKMESKVPSEDNEKPESTNRSEKVRSSAQTGVKKRRRLNATPNKDLNEPSSILELLAESSSKTLQGFEEAPQTRLRRRHTTATEIQNYNESLVGRKIKVWWPMDRTFYEGVVNSYDPAKGKHEIVYDDGDVEVLNLKKQRWKLITDDVSADEEQGTGFLKLAEAPDISRRGKQKSES